jgi:hypothetical protein
MRKGALIAALAAVAVLAILWTQRWTMGCSIEHKILTPDGAEFVFSGPRIKAGAPDRDWALEGDGLPPIEHLQQEIYGMPGALFKGTVVKPRVLTITTTTHSVTEAALRDIKARMHGAFRWDRGDPGEPSIYRYTINGISRDLYVHYDGDVEQVMGPAGLVRVVGARLISCNPFWHDPATQEQVLDWQDTFSMRLVMARESGIWNPMGPPAAAGVGIVATDIYAIAVDPLTGDVYFGGDFTNFDNEPLADFLVRWRAATGTWEAVGDNGAGGPALTERVECLYFGPDNRLYVGGRFVNAGGVANADYIAVVDVTTDTWSAPAAAPNEVAGRIVYDVVMGSDGYIYVTGNFLNWSGLGSPAGDYIARAVPGGAWATVGNGLNNHGYTLAKAPNGDVVVGGAFTTAGGLARKRIAWRDLSAGTWLDLDGGAPAGAVWNIEFAPSGEMYVTGNLPTIGSGPTTVNNFAKWNGSQWQACGTGLDNIGYGLIVTDDGSAVVTGAFTVAGGLVVDRLARWNGHAWAYLDVVLPVTGNIYRGLARAENGDLYFGCREVGTATVAGDNAAVNTGNAFTLPIIEIKNHGVLKTIINETTGKELMFALSLQDGEILTLDLSSGIKSAESTWRGNCLGDLLPASDMATFCLESDPRAAYGGVEGSNLVTIFLTDGAAREHNDGWNQLSGWDNITGVSQHNTTLGKMWWAANPTGGGWWRLDLSATAWAAPELVGYIDYNAPGMYNVIPVNDSGLGGTITVDAVVGAANGQVVFTIVTMSWRERWWDLDAAVS